MTKAESKRRERARLRPGFNPWDSEAEKTRRLARAKLMAESDTEPSIKVPESERGRELERIASDRHERTKDQFIDVETFKQLPKRQKALIRGWGEKVQGKKDPERYGRYRLLLAVDHLFKNNAAFKSCPTDEIFSALVSNWGRYDFHFSKIPFWKDEFVFNKQDGKVFDSKRNVFLKPRQTTTYKHLSHVLAAWWPHHR